MLGGANDLGVSIEILEIKGEKYLFSGWSLDIYASKNRAGLGIAKDIYDSDFFEVDVGLYASRRLKDFLDSKTEISVGFSAGWKF